MPFHINRDSHDKWLDEGLKDRMVGTDPRIDVPWGAMVGRRKMRCLMMDDVTAKATPLHRKHLSLLDLREVSDAKSDLGNQLWQLLAAGLQVKLYSFPRFGKRIIN